MPRKKPIDRLRAICLAYPEATEKLSHGEPTFFVKGKVFAMFDNNHHDSGHVGVWCATAVETQDVLVRANPQVYFVPPYVGHRGWTGVRLDGSVDWGELEAVIDESYRRVAPRRLLAQLDAP